MVYNIVEGIVLERTIQVVILDREIWGIWVVVDIRISRRDRNLLESPELRGVRCSVRIVGLQIPRCGGEMKKENQFVMHAVFSIPSSLLRDLCLTRDVGLYHKLHNEHRPIQMKKTVIKRRKRIVPTNYSPGPGQPPPQGHLPTRYPSDRGPPSNSSNSPSPPPGSHHALSPHSHNPYAPLPPLWAGHRHSSGGQSTGAPATRRQSFSPEPTDFTNSYRISNYNTSHSPNFPSTYNETITLPPLRLPLSHHHHPDPTLSPPLGSIQHVGNAIPLPKRKLSSPELQPKRLRSIDSLLNPPSLTTDNLSPRFSEGARYSFSEDDPLEGARALLNLGSSRENLIRKRAELKGEIDVLAEKMEKLKRALNEVEEFLDGHKG